MYIKLLVGLSALGMLTACGGGSDGSAVNPTQSPTSFQDFEMLMEPASVNNTWGANTALNPNTKFVILSGVDEVRLGSDHEETHYMHYLTTDIELAERMTNEDIPVSLRVATTTEFDYIDATDSSNVVLRNGNIIETDPNTIRNPYLYLNNYGENEHIQIYLDARRYSDDYLQISASGPQFSGIPNGEVTLSGRSVIHRVDNTNTNQNAPLGRFLETSVEGGVFTLRINVSDGIGTFRSESANSTVVAQSVIVDANTGMFTSDNLNITHIGSNYIGRLDGALHSEADAVTGVFASTDTSPTVVGAFAGTR